MDVSEGSGGAPGWEAHSSARVYKGVVTRTQLALHSAHLSNKLRACTTVRANFAIMCEGRPVI